jgi:hypothetical protein
MSWLFGDKQVRLNDNQRLHLQQDQLVLKFGGLINNKIIPRIAVGGFMQAAPGQIDVLGHGGETIATFNTPLTQTGKAYKTLTDWHAKPNQRAAGINPFGR